MTSELYEHAMVFLVFIFIFLFRNNVIREHLDENDFRRCYGFVVVLVFVFESVT